MENWRISLFLSQVYDDQSITSSLTSIPEWAKNSASRRPPPLFSSSSPHSLSPLSTGFIEGGLDLISPEFNSSPRNIGFGDFSMEGERFEMRGVYHEKQLSVGEGERETGFMAVSATIPTVTSQSPG